MEGGLFCGGGGDEGCGVGVGEGVSGVFLVWVLVFLGGVAGGGGEEIGIENGTENGRGTGAGQRFCATDSADDGRRCITGHWSTLRGKRV